MRSVWVRVHVTRKKSHSFGHSVGGQANSMGVRPIVEQTHCENGSFKLIHTKAKWWAVLHCTRPTNETQRKQCPGAARPASRSPPDMTLREFSFIRTTLCVVSFHLLFALRRSNRPDRVEMLPLTSLQVTQPTNSDEPCGNEMRAKWGCLGRIEWGVLPLSGSLCRRFWKTVEAATTSCKTHRIRRESIFLRDRRMWELVSRTGRHCRSWRALSKQSFCFIIIDSHMHKYYYMMSNYNVPTLLCDSEQCSPNTRSFSQHKKCSTAFIKIGENWMEANALNLAARRENYINICWYYVISIKFCNIRLESIYHWCSPTNTDWNWNVRQIVAFIPGAHSARYLIVVFVLDFTLINACMIYWTVRKKERAGQRENSVKFSRFNFNSIWNS